jgi:hypothetical protein
MRLQLKSTQKSPEAFSQGLHKSLTIHSLSSLVRALFAQQDITASNHPDLKGNFFFER